MKVASASTCRMGDWQIEIGDPFIIASREQDSADGTFVFPVLRNLNGTLFLNWHHDWDVLDGAFPDKPSGRLSRDGGRTWSQPVALPIRGVDPHLAPLPNALLALATGRPDCTLHFSADRGRTWSVSNILFTVGGSGPGHLAYQGHQDEKTYDGSTCNVEWMA